MKTVAITVHNNKKLELFVEKRKDGFEVWIVGPVQDRRTVLDHHLTHDDLEARLEYAKAGDLLWRDAEGSEIPTEKHRNAVEAEETIKQSTFWDFENLHQSVTGHLGAIGLLSENKDKVEWNAAKRVILGRWTDGIVTASFEPNNKLRWTCTDPQHPFNVGERVHGHAPDWWNFAMWGIALLNNEHKCGTHIGVLRVDEQELHLSSSFLHRMAHVFQRIGRLEGSPLQKPEPVSIRPKKVNRVAGVATPILRRLEQAVIGRNPLLAERLKPGLPESDIRNALNRASVAGAIEPLVELYSWRNGTALDENTPMEETSFFPVDVYQFLDLETALNQMESIHQAAAQLQEMVQGTEAHSMFSGMSGRLFPLFSDGATGTIAVDLTPSKQNRVVAIEFESTEPVRQAYGSFEEFIKDAIRANREDNNLSCFQ